MGTGTFKDSQNGGALPARVTAAARPALQRRGTTVAKAELGTKRIDPETGRKFYDLNKDPIVSPYTGKSYPRSYFDSGDTSVEEEEVEEKEVEGDDEAPEVISLEDADEEGKDDNDNLPDLGDDEDDVEIDDDEDDTFLPDEEEEDDDVNDIIGVGGDDDDEV